MYNKKSYSSFNRRFSLATFALSIAMSGGLIASTPKVLLAQVQTEKIAQVKSGELKEAHASWWGFDKADSTEALQEAINSGATKIIVDNMGSDWIIANTINLAANQEVIFQNGVVIQTKKGEFQRTGESLFVGSKIKNTTLTGEGNVIFQMNREDYANPKLYEKSEHRHGIALRDCENFTMRNITVKDTGGDGLYVGAASDKGYSKNVLVEDCVFDKNYRQGISVISAEDFIVRGCKLIGTKGTAPEAGIDFEPNRPAQRLVNCRIEDTDISGNAGSGIEINVRSLNTSSMPISITAERCTVQENAKKPVNIVVTRNSETLPQGKVLLSDCHFASGEVFIEGAVKDAVDVTIENSTLDLREVGADRSPIILKTDPSMENALIDGIEFNNFTIKTTENKPPIDIQIQRQGNVSDQVSGKISLDIDGKVIPFDFAGFIKQQQKYFSDRNAAEPEIAEFDSSKLRAPATGQAREGNGTFYLGGKFTFLQYAKKGDKIQIDVKVKKVHARKTIVELFSPSGEKLETFDVPYDNTLFPIVFTAEETGFYQVKRSQASSQYIDITSANPGNGIALDDSIQFLPKKGNLYFEVPAGVKEFTVGVSTSSRDAPATVALIDPSGKEVERHDVALDLQLFSVTQEDAAQSEIWSLKVLDAAWVVTPYLYGDLPAVVSTNPHTLLRAK